MFDYYTDVSESDGFVEGKCGSCSTKIRGKTGVSSNFMTHLKVSMCSNRPSLCSLVARKFVHLSISHAYVPRCVFDGVYSLFFYTEEAPCKI